MNNIKNYVFTVLATLLFFQSYSQFQIKEGTYTSFDGRKIDVYLIEGIYSVLNIDKKEITQSQLLDISTLNKILTRTDFLYAFYKNNLGFEPSGGNPLYGNKVNVFFGPPSCGAGCGLVGRKGIEVSFFQNIFTKFKLDIKNVLSDRIIGYEFGRNFFIYSSKILFPISNKPDQTNGGFAEGFANVLYTYAYNEILTSDEERIFNDDLFYLSSAKDFLLYYLNDTTANPYNFLAEWKDTDYTPDPNRRKNPPPYTAFGILHGTFETFGKEKLFPKFFTELGQTKNAQTIEEALSNIALATSKSLNLNLIGYFQNALKFNLTNDAITQLKSLPEPQSKLIKYEDLLWFVSPFHTIKMNLRSTNYLLDNCFYRISIDDRIFSENTNGNNSIPYSIMKDKEEVVLKCQLLDKNKKILDSFETKIKKRHRINILDYPSKISFYYQYSNNTKVQFSNNVIVLENQSSEFDHSLLSFNLLTPKNRILSASANIKQVNPNINNGGGSAIEFRNANRTNGSLGVGGQIGKGDSVNYYFVKVEDNSNYFASQYDINYANLNMTFGAGGNGPYKSYIKDIYLEDITDTDNDGIIDFEDACPEVFGKFDGCPQILTSVSNVNTDEFILYPNPPSNKLNIKTMDIKGEIEIYDIFGNLVVHQKINKNNTEIDVSKLSQGTYFVHVISNNRIQTSKFIKM